MTWFKVDDSLHSHKKAMRAGVEAMGLWVLAGSWAADQLTDGWIPSYVAQRIAPNIDELAAKLVRAGFWVEGEHDGDEGWWFHEWRDRQPTREEVLERRQKRADAGRRGGLRSGEVRRAATEAHEASGEANASLVVEAKANPDPTRPVQKKKTSSNRRLDQADVDPKFAEFWNAYPRREAKKEAQKRFLLLVSKGLDPKVLIDGARRYATYVVKAGREREKIRLPTTWLNQGNWDDELDDGAARVVPIGDPEQWLRRAWTDGDVGAIERATGLRYDDPDVPDEVQTPEQLRAFRLTSRREWIVENHDEIIDRLIVKEEAA